VAAPDGTGADPAEPRLRLLVLQPTPFCNIDCSYCYLPHRTSRARMSLATLDLVCQRVFESARLDFASSKSHGMAENRSSFRSRGTKTRSR
jgi:hypothetical protein